MKMSKMEFLSFANLAGLSILITSLTACAPTNNSYSPVVDADSSAKIVGGTKVPANDELEKSVVFLINRSSSTMCSGVIVGNSTIATAAHCVQGHAKSLRFWFGRNFYNSRVIRNGLEVKYPTAIASGQAIRGDLALVRINGSIPEGFKPVPMTTLANETFDTSQIFKIAGFGDTSSHDERSYGVLHSADARLYGPFLTTTQFWLTTHPIGGACGGDSGGATFIRRSGKLVLMGIMSKVGNKECSSGLLISTRVAPFAESVKGILAAWR